MSKYRTTVRLSAPLRHTFDKTFDYFISRGYVNNKTVLGSLIQFSREGSKWTSSEIDATHTLTISFDPEGDDVLITFYYHCSAGMGSFTKRSIRTIDMEIHTLSDMIMRTRPKTEEAAYPDRICVKCMKGIPLDAGSCNHCGYDFSEKREGRIRLHL